MNIIMMAEVCASSVTGGAKRVLSDLPPLVIPLIMQVVQA